MKCEEHCDRDRRESLLERLFFAVIPASKARLPVPAYRQAGGRLVRNPSGKIPDKLE